MKNKFLIKKSRDLRNNPTIAENKLWYFLRNRQIENFKFRRQQPIGDYIVDFACLEKKIIVEIDGGQHFENNEDSIRDQWLTSQGYRVLRFWNNDVIQNIESVLEIIRKACIDTK
jgi:very-short-patch-repair endonuclease